MDIIRKKVQLFLKNKLFDISFNIDKFVDIFLIDMKNGLNKVESSLKMLKLNLSFSAEMNKKKSEKLIVIDAGGTNLRIATVSFNKKNNFFIEKIKIFKMPGIDKEISADEFFKKISEYISPFLENIKKVGFCFSYPTESINNDGKVLALSKEIKIRDIEGVILGESLNKYFKNKKDIIVINDTVATLYSGLTLLNNGNDFSSYIGFVLGTGTNCSFLYNNDEKKYVINVESGNFNKLERSLFDLELINTTKEKNSYILEKMVAGRYLGDIANIAIRHAINDSLFSSKNIDELFKEISLTTLDLSFFLANPLSDNNLIGRICKNFTNKDDVIVLYLLFEQIVERAAKISAGVVIAISIFLEKGFNPLYPICTVCDGSTFNKVYKFKEKFFYYIYEFLLKKRNIYSEFYSIDNAPIIGTAVASILNL